jgi:hypothetical protein
MTGSGVIPEHWPTPPSLRSKPWKRPTSFRTALRAHGFREVESRHDEAAFGSWLIVVDDPPVRVVWDGKEHWLVVQQQTGDEWADMWLAREEADQTSNAVAEQLTLLRRHS